MTIVLISQSINAQSKIILKNISKEHFESIKNIVYKPSFILRTANINSTTKSVLFIPLIRYIIWNRTIKQCLLGVLNLFWH